jgi:hypothetical protein
MSTFMTSARIFPCANCGEMIYSDSATCRFCSAPVDSSAAEAAADLQKHVNNAVNQAKWTRNTAGAMCVLVALGFIFGAAMLGAIACIFLIPLSVIHWQIKYAGLKTNDPDFPKAKRDRLIALALWLPASIIQLLILFAQVLF